MAEICSEEIQAYLDRYYLDAAVLVERAGCELTQLQTLQAAQCLPVHSYEVRRTQTFTSTFGDHASAGAVRRYYHPSVAAWLRVAAERATQMSLAQVARAFREDFELDFAAALAGREPPWPGGVDYAWAYLMDGTWGLCLREISAQNMLIKEFARIEFRRAMARAESSPPSEAELQSLRTAIADYSSVVLPFAPHEVAASSTSTELAVVLKRYAEWL